MGDNIVVDSVTTWSEATLAVIGVIALAWAGMKKLYRMARNIESLVTTMEQNSHEILEIKKQVLPNGGTSLRDAVNRIEASAVKIDARVLVLENLPCHLRLEAERIENGA